MNRPGLRTPPHSQGYIWVGAKLDTYFIRYSPRQELYAKTGMSIRQIRFAHFGTHDFILSDLQRISEVLDVNLSMKLAEGRVLFANNEPYCLFQPLENRSRFRGRTASGPSPAPEKIIEKWNCEVYLSITWTKDHPLIDNTCSTRP